MDHGGAEPEPLGHPGAEPFDQHVGVDAQVEHGAHPRWIAQIDGDRSAATVEHRVVRGPTGSATGAGTVDPDHVGPEVGQHHPGERDRPDPAELDDRDPREGTVHAPIRPIRSRAMISFMISVVPP